MRVIRYLPFNYLLPSEIGTVRTTKMYVLGEYVKEVLKKRGIPEKEMHSQVYQDLGKYLNTDTLEKTLTQWKV